jgi:hypothetical protein
LALVYADKDRFRQVVLDGLDYCLLLHVVRRHGEKRPAHCKVEDKHKIALQNLCTALGVLRVLAQPLEPFLLLLDRLELLNSHLISSLG